MHSARKRREGSSKKLKRRRADEHEDVRDDDVFHDDEPTAREEDGEADAEQEDTETAADKRLRIGAVPCGCSVERKLTLQIALCHSKTHACFVENCKMPPLPQQRQHGRLRSDKFRQARAILLAAMSLRGPARSVNDSVMRVEQLAVR